ncbi:S24 family peptidase [Paenirhodobacter enshiensis]|uniref:S24 family peptidase n=1 Tax=Paenirhodobacter enshiensis TaxID=1105367 RepID=UPI001268AAFE|nr:S24 family peptidase [Paenirhodobacter enshiensis]
MEMLDVLKRIEEWIAAQNEAGQRMSPRSLSLKALGTTDTIRNWIRSRDAGKPIGATERSVSAVARAMNVSGEWLRTGTGNMNDVDPPHVDMVSLVSWVSAGQLSDQDSVVSPADYPTIPVADLPPSRWIALRVQGTSMNKLSPPDSVIIVDLNDKRLVNGRCYVIADESGAATYKAYDPNSSPPFVPRSYIDTQPPALTGSIRIVGRVRKTILDL